MDALVYVNHGRVIVDCPYQCGNAYIVAPGQKTRVCDAKNTGCNYEFRLAVSKDIPEIVRELDKRPVKANRNWFPEGHPIAVRGKYPMGQTVADLAAEFKMERGKD